MHQKFFKASFTYWFLGKGWTDENPNVEEPPTKTVVARCDGPDAGYIATSGCVLAAALTLLHDKENLPKKYFITFVCI